MPLPQEKYYSVDDFYNLPDDILAELINGRIVYMATPSSKHQIISSELHFAINSYIKSKNGRCRVLAAPFGVQLRKEEDTVLQPDISVICNTEKITPKCCVGAPDWIIEIVSPSNPGHDYITKLGLYHEAGVREYWIVDAQREYIHVYDLITGDLKIHTFHDTVKAGIYEDLYIDFSSLSLDV